MKLYSKNGSEPDVVHMLVFSDGSTRTANDHNYTEEDLKKAGYTGPYYRPEYNEYFQQLIWDSNNLKYEVIDYPDEFYFERVRAIRDSELRSTDHFMLEDSPITAEEKQQYKNYRNWLRRLLQKMSDAEPEESRISIPRTEEEFRNLFSLKNSFLGITNELSPTS